MAPPEKFDWRDYITLREPREDFRKQFEDILDRIASTPDGQELFRKAMEVSGGGTHKVELSTSNDNFTLGGKPMPANKNWNSTGNAEIHKNEKGEYEGKVSVDLRRAGTVGWIAPDGKVVASSRTDTIVHELYHIADPNRLPEVMAGRYKLALRAEASKMFGVEGLDEKTRDTLLTTAVDRVLSDRSPSKTDMGKMADPELLKDLQKIAGDHKITFEKPSGRPFESMYGSVVGKDSFPAAPKGVKPVHPYDGAGPRHEEQATDYVDRFMLKYFGRPPQQGYGNLVTLPPGTPVPEEPKLLDKPLPDVALPDYKPDVPPASLGTFPKPPAFVVPPAPAAPVKGK